MDDIHSLPLEERIELYEDRAEQLRRMAAAEPVARHRDQMLALAKLYESLPGILQKPLGWRQTAEGI